VPHHVDLAGITQEAAEAVDEEDEDQEEIMLEKGQQRVLRKKVVRHGVVEGGIEAREDEATVQVHLRPQIWLLGSRKSLLRHLRHQARMSRRCRRRSMRRKIRMRRCALFARRLLCIVLSRLVTIGHAISARCG
jgi:hypothetical protein